MGGGGGGGCLTNRMTDLLLLKPNMFLTEINK